MSARVRLSFRPQPRPSLESLDDLARTRLGPHLRAYRSLADVELFDVLGEEGAPVYDLVLYRGEDGTVYRHGTLEHVASFSQSSACESEDEALLDALDEAFRAMVTGSTSRTPPPPATR